MRLVYNSMGISEGGGLTPGVLTVHDLMRLVQMSLKRRFIPASSSGPRQVRLTVAVYAGTVSVSASFLASWLGTWKLKHAKRVASASGCDYHPSSG
jgi:hypothetical protein